MEKEKKSKKKLFIIIGIILLLLIIGFLIWWFNRKFDITFKYNNGTNDNIVKVKYLNYIKKEDIKEDLTASNKSFVGYFETYLLSDKELETIKNDKNKEKDICKEGFKLNSDKNKCIAENEFDFTNTKIKKHTTIEALWSGISFKINPTSKTLLINEKFKISTTLSGTNDNTIKWSSDNKNIATVDKNGNVTAIKKGTANIYAESNGIKRKCVVTVKTKETTTTTTTTKKTTTTTTTTTTKPKDNGTISLKANDQCIIGNNNTVTITATIKNALDDTITWTLPKCYTAEKVSNTVVKLTRTGRGTQCRTEEERSFTVIAKLKNGNSSSLKFTFEPNLEAKVYNNDSLLATLNNGANSSFRGNKISVKTNVDATFKGVSPWSGKDYIASKTNTSMTLKDTSDADVTIKTTCGQSAKFSVEAIIN